MNKISPWLADIWSLVWPTDDPNETNETNEIANSSSSSNSGDDLLDLVANTCRQVILLLKIIFSL